MSQPNPGGYPLGDGSSIQFSGYTQTCQNSGLKGRSQPSSELNYSCRNASIGSSLAADMAGYIPNSTPIDTAMQNAMGTLDGTKIG